MKIIYLMSLFGLLLGIQGAPAGISNTLITSTILPQKSFDQWYSACALLPEYNKNFSHTALTYTEFSSILEEYTAHLTHDTQLVLPAYWLNTVATLEELYNTTCTPYAQKLIVKPGSKIAFHGDLHGDIHALNNFIRYLQKAGYLQNFTVIQDDFYLVFLGDYTDRGYYGAEVWYTIMRLKLANPNRVFMVRGNHEDQSINDRYGFTAELKAKFGTHTDCATNLYALYNFLPVVLYLGSGSAAEINYLQCCHGGLELGFDPKPLFIDQRPIINTFIFNDHKLFDRGPILNALSPANRYAIQRHIPKKLLDPFCIDAAYDIGFMWNDFIINTVDPVELNPRGWKCGKQLTLDLLSALSTQGHVLRGIFRAHQHGDLEMMQRILNRDNKGHQHDVGVGKLWTDHAKIKEAGALWDGIVCTFLVAPAAFGTSPLAPFDFDAFGILTTAEEFNHWHLQMVQTKQRV